MGRSAQGTLSRKIGQSIQRRKHCNLLIYHIFHQDSANAVPTASKKIIYPSPSLEVSLSDEKPPKIINFTTRASVNASQNVRLFCETEGKPPLAFKWFRNGRLIGSCKGDLERKRTCFLHRQQGKYNVSWRGSGTELVIKKAFHPFDTGVFTCVAMNSAGTDNKTVTLDIHGRSLIKAM